MKTNGIAIVGRKDGTQEEVVAELPPHVAASLDRDAEDVKGNIASTSGVVGSNVSPDWLAASPARGEMLHLINAAVQAAVDPLRERIAHLHTVIGDMDALFGLFAKRMGIKDEEAVAAITASREARVAQIKKAEAEAKKAH